MIRPITLIVFGLAVCLGTGMFKVKYAVQGDEQKLVVMQQQMVDDQNALHVLHAEWSAETQPQQLGEMAERHLTLMPVNGQQMASFDSLPRRPGGPAAPVAATPSAPLLAANKPARQPVVASLAALPSSIATAPVARVAEAQPARVKPHERTVVASAGDSTVDAVLAAMQSRSAP